MNKTQMQKQIQWYPGHMFKSMREIRERLKIIDLVIILLDARLPFSSMNPEILKTVKMKPVLLLFNKSSLADPNRLSYHVQKYEEMSFTGLNIDAVSRMNVNKIHRLAQDLLKDKLERAKAKGLKERPIRTMILGIPNVGKSTLINTLAQRKAARTANTPGITRAQQWIKLSSDFELLDTPGVLWPKFDDPKVAYHLAITGAIKDDIMPIDDVCHYALKFLKQYYPDRLLERYEIPHEMDDIGQMLHQIGVKRGALLKGGDIDELRVYQIILTDIRNKQLGGLTFDRT